MAYLAVLAYPRQSEWVKRDRFIEAAKALLFKWWIRRAANSQEKKERRAAIPKEYREFKNEQIDGAFRALQRRIVIRLRAAEAAGWFFIHGLTFGPYDCRQLGWPPGALSSKPITFHFNAKAFSNVEKPTRWTAALGLSERLQEDRRQSRPDEGRYVGSHAENMSTRILRDSEPVLHLAKALPLAEAEDGSPKLEIANLLMNPSWLDRSLREAELWRCALFPSFIPKYEPTKTVCLLAEDDSGTNTSSRF